MSDTDIVERRYERRGVKEIWDLVTDQLITEFATAGRHVDAYIEALNLGNRLAIERLRAGRAAVVEECAKVAESLNKNYEPEGWAQAALESAAYHIRALKETP